jgi:hypothetical protein
MIKLVVSKNLSSFSCTLLSLFFINWFYNLSFGYYVWFIFQSKFLINGFGSEFSIIYSWFGFNCIATKYFYFGNDSFISATLMKWVGFPFLLLKAGSLWYLEPLAEIWYLGLS